MSHNCNHDEHHDHDHDHGNEAQDSPASDNLYQYIDHPNVRILNAIEDAQILKPWDKRFDEDVFVESDADDQLLIRVPFTGSVKLRSILIKSGPGNQTPSKVLLFANEGHLDFDDVNSRIPTEELPVAQSRDVGAYTVKPAKFSNISSVTLFIPSSQGAETTQIYFLGFLGSFSSQRKEAPSVIIYEAYANPSDHPKIPGTDSGFTSDQIK